MKEDSLAEKVYLEIRGKILSNQLVPGSRLKEDAWAKKMEVSRVAIREALIRLLGEGLLVKGEKSGYFVKSMSMEDLKQIRELREVLELGALQLACQKINEQQILELEKICEDFSLMVSSGYYGGACEADVKFHECLFDIADNDKLTLIYKSSNIPLFHFKLGRASQMDDYEKTDREHREILSAIKDKDFEKAMGILRSHLHRGELESLDLG
ncbi:FCD domain-containing protein [Sphingobacterium sp. DK4209]|uniref:FCD domain-containing protein n=1 Tax=Sphingobacterium zhuxiongii TaxID=2662364 RepID=A0A5Q0QHW4_9SPHI|nr:MULTISPECIES: GntR family transcriptional regulator [unclassified Sphingobacterium]MVZ64682.1 FCD domain-containing protein [Sphingobacterium sp. DK4209]QGA27020.1 FCD domain-containing protein [Sphingobacterium sp. dk4302]